MAYWNILMAEGGDGGEATPWQKRFRATSRRPTRSRATTISRSICSSASRTRAGSAGPPLSIRAARWTYGQLIERAKKFSTVLTEKGIQPGERVLMCLLDTADWPAVFLGTLYAGRVAVPVNTLMTEDDYRYMLADSGARMLVVSQALLPKFEKLVAATARLSPDRRWQPRGAAASGSRSADRRGDAARSARCPRPATRSRSGSTPRARPASRRRRCMCMPTSS